MSIFDLWRDFQKEAKVEKGEKKSGDSADLKKLSLVDFLPMVCSP